MIRNSNNFPCASLPADFVNFQIHPHISLCVLQFSREPHVDPCMQINLSYPSGHVLAFSRLHCTFSSNHTIPQRNKWNYPPFLSCHLNGLNSALEQKPCCWSLKCHNSDKSIIIKTCRLITAFMFPFYCFIHLRLGRNSNWIMKVLLWVCPLMALEGSFLVAHKMSQ